MLQPPTEGCERRYGFRSSVRLSVNTIISRDAISLLYKSTFTFTSVLSGRISMKLGTTIHLVSGHCRKRFSRSEVKCQGHSESQCTSVAEACIRVFGGVASKLRRDARIHCNFREFRYATLAVIARFQCRIPRGPVSHPPLGDGPTPSRYS